MHIKTCRCILQSAGSYMHEEYMYEAGADLGAEILCLEPIEHQHSITRYSRAIRRSEERVPCGLHVCPNKIRYCMSDAHGRGSDTYM